jgi:hypothetical protein
MPEVRWVECRCGYRTRLEVERYGRPWECPVCLLVFPLSEENTEPVLPARPHLRETPPAVHHDLAPGQEPESTSDVMLFEDLSDTDEAAAVQGGLAPFVSEDLCAGCGRTFRGDWDHVSSGDATICHICANRGLSVATAHPKPIVPDDDGYAKELARAQSANWAALAPPEHEELTEADRRERRRHLKIYAVVSAVILLAVLLWPSEDGQFGAVVAPEELPPAAIWTAFALQTLLRAAGTIAAFYITLLLANALPNETVSANILAICFVILPLLAGFMLVDLFFHAILPPDTVAIVLFMVGIVEFIFVMWLFLTLYEPKLRYVLLLFVLLNASGRLAAALGVMVQQAISGLVT